VSKKIKGEALMPEAKLKLNLTDQSLKVVGFLIICLLAYLFLHADLSSGQSSVAKQNNTASVSGRPSSAPSNAYAALSPATVPSKAAECAQVLTFNSNGTSGPLTCAGGELNVTEWEALSALEPTVLTLGYGASAPQVQTALCNDVSVSQSDANTQNANLVEQNAYQMAALYYGWVFSANPSAVLTSGGC
jgi:hypothetical protein